MDKFINKKNGKLEAWLPVFGDCATYWCKNVIFACKNGNRIFKRNVWAYTQLACMKVPMKIEQK